MSDDIFVQDEEYEHNPIADDILAHYGVKRRSGRYPWGSGDHPFQSSGDFISRVDDLKSQGFTKNEIVNKLGFDTVNEYNLAYSVATNERRRLLVDRVHSMKSDGLSTSEIARQLNKSESSIRSLLNTTSEDNMNVGAKTADILKKEIAKKHYIDVGSDVERELGVSHDAMKKALYILQNEGYNVIGVGIKQQSNPTSGNQTIVKTLAEPTDDPKAQYRALYQDTSLIQSVGEYHSIDGGQRWDKREYPAPISSDRVKIRYAEDGGLGKDGVIEIRRGCDDLNLGNSHYAQVRILVDGTHYLKGMAIYSDDLPAGTDILFNTNKSSKTKMIDGDHGVLKPIKDDKDNPFGAYIAANGQSFYVGKDGKKHLSSINKLKEEGDWQEQSVNLSSQFLSKQPQSLINKQLDLTYADKVSDYEDILSVTNPVVRKKLLNDFASSCDSAAVHLKSASLPRQATRVILPVPELKSNEVYAPYLRNGEHVVLIRYPHGGTFEIPELVVNNKNAAAKKTLGPSTLDAIGINAKVAERLSGADFDGDTVTVIPVNSKVKVKTTPALKQLKGFDPKTAYSYHDGMRIMSKSNTGKQMGIVSNLITDMTLQGAPVSEIARAVRHSMVVIDAAKHKLDYKQSEKDNGIEELKKRWQIHYDDSGNIIKTGGASTLLSRRKTTVDVPETKGAARIDPVTGQLTYKESGRTYIDKAGKEVRATTSRPLLLTISDARSISSGTPQEEAYAEFSNRMRALGNTARKEYMATSLPKRVPSAVKTYKEQVASLDAQLDNAARNAPRERRAQALANSHVRAQVQANPYLKDKNHKKELTKLRQAAIADARVSVGASSKDRQITISLKEWEAIQAGAVSSTKLSKMLRYCDTEKVTQLAMPRASTTLSTAKQGTINSMRASGYTIAEIADRLGVSTTTVSKYIK